MEKQSLCKLKSTPSENLSAHRPAPHSILAAEDDSFDYRLIANLKYQEDVLDIYKTVLLKKHDQLLCGLAGVLHHNCRLAEHSDCSSSLANLSIINTCLSDADRSFMVNDIILKYLERNLKNCIILRCSSHQSKAASACDILKHVNEEFKYKLHRLAGKDRRKSANISTKRSRKSDHNSVSSSSSAIPSYSTVMDPAAMLQELFRLHCSSEETSKIIESLHHDFSTKQNRNISDDPSILESTQPFIVIVLESLESISSEVLASLLTKLKDAKIRCHVLAFNSSYCSMPLRLCSSVSSTLKIGFMTSSTPWELYDLFLEHLLTSDSIPVIFSGPFFTLINEHFFRSQCCLYSVVTRLRLCLNHHFSMRRSLLCVFKDYNYIDQTLIISHKAKDKDKTSQLAELGSNIGKLMSYMDANDCSQEQGFFFSRIGERNSEAERRQAQTIVLTEHFRNSLDVVLFKCVQIARDIALPKEIRKEYCCDVLWIAIQNSREIPPLPSDDAPCSLKRKKAGLIDFLIDLKLCLPKIPLFAVISMVQEWTLCIQSALERKIDIDFLPLLKNECQVMLNHLSEYDIVLTMYVDSLHESKVSSRLSFAQISILFDEEKVVDQTSSEYIEIVRLCKLHANYSGGPFQEPSAPWFGLEMTYDSIVDSMRGFLHGCLRIFRPAPLSGILRFSDSVHAAVKQSTGTIRSTSAEVWRCLENYIGNISDNGDIPDTSHIIRSLGVGDRGGGSMTYQVDQLYQEFLSSANVWAGDLSTLPVKRKSGVLAPAVVEDDGDSEAEGDMDSDSDDPAQSSDLQMRCRFFQALIDVEKTGLAKIKRDQNGKTLVFDRQIAVWT